MSRLNKSEEIIKLAIMFQNSSSGLCIDDIQKEFECSRRSAERMKSVLYEMFSDKIDVVTSSDKKKRWKFKKGTINYLISFSRDDITNLEYLKNFLSNEPARQKQIDEIIAKIKALTPQNITSLDTDIAAIMETEGFPVRQYSKIKIDIKILEILRSSLLSFKKIKFNYPIDNTQKEITLNPYGIIISDKYYLVGYNEHVQGLRLYKIDKMNEVKMLDEYYDKDESFSLQEYCNNSFGIYQEKPIDVVLEFDKSVKEDVLSYHFHPTQKIKELKNGNLQLEFTSGGKKAICYELFKWGNNVQIKSPKELKLFYKELLESPLKYLK